VLTLLVSTTQQVFSSGMLEISFRDLLLFA
jgi:hypothetical protein